jgi:hypothetical protein
MFAMQVVELIDLYMYFANKFFSSIQLFYKKPWNYCR